MLPPGDLFYYSPKINFMGMLKEFKEFAVKGNVIDLAVGVIIGGAFGQIVNSVINDLIMPLVAGLIGSPDFVEKNTFTRGFVRAPEFWSSTIASRPERMRTSEPAG